MTPSAALRQWIANGCRPDDSVLVECGATHIARSSVAPVIAWQANDGSLYIDVYLRRSVIDATWQPNEGPIQPCDWGVPFGTDLPPAFWAHLARMTEEET